MRWGIRYLPEAVRDIRRLSGNQRIIVQKAILKVSQNPLPVNDGGYGKPLGNKFGINLTNYLKIKLRGEGIRIVYKLEKTDLEMLVIIVGVREDNEVYEEAQRRIIKNQDSSSC